MTISSTTNKWTYTGNGTASAFAYTKKIFANTDLEVTVKDSDDVETTLTLTTDYTVDGVGEATGGNVTLVDDSQDWLDAEGDLDTGWTIVIRRVRPLKQETDIRNQGTYFPENIEDEFDKQIMIDQQQQEEIDRCIKLPVTTSGVSVELPTPEVGKALYWESATQLGNTSLDTVDTGTIEDLAITTDKLAADAVTGAKLADDAVDSEHIAAGAVDLEHMSANSVDSDQYVDGSVDLAHLANLANLRVIGRTAGTTGVPEAVEVLDEDNMASNSATKLATQQSIKAYVDGLVKSFGAFASKNVDTVYQADSDGIFVGYGSVPGGNAGSLLAKTDENTPPTTTIQQISKTDADGVSIPFCIPVKSGEYYMVSQTGTASLNVAYFVPLS